MIITKEAQEKIIWDFSDGGATTNEIEAFAKGMETAFNHVDKILKQKI